MRLLNVVFLFIAVGVSYGAPTKIGMDLSVVPPPDYTIPLNASLAYWPEFASDSSALTGAEAMAPSPRNNPLSNAERIRRGLPLNRPERLWEQGRTFVPRYSGAPQSTDGTFRFDGQCSWVGTCVESPCVTGDSGPGNFGTSTSQTTQQKQAALDACVTKCNSQTRTYNNFMHGWYNGGNSLACLCGYSMSTAETCTDADYSYAHYYRLV